MTTDYWTERWKAAESNQERWEILLDCFNRIQKGEEGKEAFVALHKEASTDLELLQRVLKEGISRC